MSGIGDWWAARGLHYKRSLASRVALLTTAAVGLALTLVALTGYVTVREQMQNSFDQSLMERAHLAARNPLLDTLFGEVPSWTLGAADVRIFRVDAAGTVRSADQGAKLQLGRPELEVAAGIRPQSLRTIHSERGNPYRVAAVPVSIAPDQALVIAQSQAAQVLTLQRIGRWLLLLGAAGVVVSALAGWAVARNGLRPVRRLNAAVERAAQTDELTPLRVEGEDELARLGAAFNRLLAAVEASRERQRRLVADAGHELRTPLTSLRTNLELLAMADADGGLPPEARAELLDDVRAQIEELTNLVGDLVELARDEPMAATVSLVDLAEIAERAATRVRRRAPSLGFVTELRPWWLMGEAPALERAITNLLDNAAKFSPPGGTVTMRLAGGVLTVDDEGPGIPDDERPQVFDRFYRSSESRALPGSGLGLSIVRQVAERHLGVVEVDSSPTGGARLSMTLPGRAQHPG